MSSYYLPPSTARFIERHGEGTKNLGLLLDKYMPQKAVQDSKGKGEWLRDLSMPEHIDEELAKNVYVRWLEMCEAMHAARFHAHLDWRMAVGLGGETVLETDLTLHQLYGIPSIPASALKGLTRNYVTKEVQPSDTIEQDSDEVQRIFGSQNHAGTVLFFDALPLDGRASFAVDIMNAHYPKYYSDKTLPTNDQKPNPVTFLTVTNTTFVFALAPRRSKDAEDVTFAIGWLQDALQKYGVGGKTSAGYGYFKDVGNLVLPAASDSTAREDANKPPTTDTGISLQTVVDPEVKKAEGYIRELEAHRDVAGQIHGYYQKWQQFKSQEARIRLATAIIEKVAQTGREKQSVEKAWYKELRAFLDAV